MTKSKSSMVTLICVGVAVKIICIYLVKYMAIDTYPDMLIMYLLPHW